MNEKKDNDYIDVYNILKKEPRKLFPHHDVVPNKPLQAWTVDVGKELLTNKVSRNNRERNRTDEVRAIGRLY